MAHLKTKIVIVGAGIAGLAAAKTLEENSFTDYLILEAQNEPGGRAHSVCATKGLVDCGAQFLHGSNSNLAHFCFSQELVYKDEGTDGEGLFLREDGSLMDEKLLAEVKTFVKSVCEECQTFYQKKERRKKKYESFGSILRSRFHTYLHKSKCNLEEKKLKEEILAWHVRALVVDNSCHSLEDVSTKLWGLFHHTGGSENMLLKFGYSSVTNRLISCIKINRLRLSTPVKSIYWREVCKSEDSPIIVTTSKDVKIYADAVIVTCSLGYLKENHKYMFQPPLPDKYKIAIEHLGFGTINKILLDFGEIAWWSSHTKGFQLLWQESEKHFLPTWAKDLTGFDVLNSHPAVLVGWVGGKGALIIENLSEEYIAMDCMNLLSHYLKRSDIPPIKTCIRTKWFQNKYMRGAYSYITTSCDADLIKPDNLAEPIYAMRIDEKVKPVVLFAGEATHDSHYSTAHGAYETGYKQAMRCVEHYK